jgi:tetratricopeptide (TPR) repeat protein
MLYREDFQRTYPDLATLEHSPTPLPKLCFSSAEIDKLGKIQDVLTKFLQEQELVFTQDLQAKFNQSNQVSIQPLLDAFVTEEGTKRPLAYQRRGSDILLEEKTAAQIAGLSPPMTSFVLDRMIANRLIRVQDNTLELAHDALADLINRRRTAQQRQRNEAFSRLNNFYKAYPITQEFLSRKQLNSLEDYLPTWEATLDEGIQRFIQDSYQYNEAQENEQLLVERKKRKRAMLIAGLGLFLAALTSLAFLYALYSRSQLALATYDTQLKSARIFKVQGKYAEAISILNSTRSLYTNYSATQQQNLDTLQAKWTRMLTLQKEIDLQLQRTELRQVVQNYQQMDRIDPDENLKKSIAEAEEKLKDTVEDLYKQGISLLMSGRKADARRALEKALSLDPQQAQVLQKLKEIVK